MSSTRFNPPVPTLEQITGLGESTIPDSDGFVEPGENDLASSTNKRTLRSYISSLTSGRAPTVVAAGERGIIEYNGLVPDHGNAYPLDDGSGPNRNTFATVDGGGVNLMQEDSNSGLFDGINSNNLDDIINKGELGSANGEDPLSGHLLLQGIVGSTIAGGAASARTDGAQVLIDSIPRTLDRNIWNPYSSDTGDDGSRAERPTGLIKTSRGEGMLSSSPSAAAGRVSVEELSKVAIDIMLRSSGKDKGPDHYTDFDAGLKASNVQEGFSRVSTNDLEARNYKGIEGLNSTVEGTGISFPDDDGVGTTAYSNTSHGSVYNPLESFSRLDSAISSYGVLALVAYGTVAAVGGILSATPPSTKAPTYRRLEAKKYDKLEKGKFKFERKPNAFDILTDTVGVSTDVTQLLNVYVPTNSFTDYGQCVVIGFASLVGLTYNEDELKILADNPNGTRTFDRFGLLKLAGLTAARLVAIAATGEKGYYLNLFREIVKDTGQVAGAIGADPQSLLTPSEGLGSILGSKIVRFVDTLARIGDLLVLQEHAKSLYRFNETQTVDPYDSGFNPTDSGKKIVMKDFAAQRIRGAQFGSRRGSYLGTNQLPSAHLIPEKYSRELLTDDLNGTKVDSYAGDKNVKSAGGGTNLRIDQERVAAIEEVLDSEYMPFYFHDLRTNEIISFHAFLEDLSDSYQANYNSAGGYGRIEEIKTYKDTKRSVSVTFNVVATNPEDFDYMWWQINKLTTMVYPQWSRGRALKAKVENQDFDFIQPFSQVPNATPVIRMRVGDLIRSNYSRFNLKRLFGYYDPKTKQDDAGRRNLYTVKPGDYIPIGGGDIVTVTRPFTIGDKFPDLVETGSPYYSVYSSEVGAFIAVTTEEIESSAGKTKNALSKVFYEADDLNAANSVIRAFETSMSKGLAGVVTQLQFTWMDQGILWGAGDDGPGNRAPRACKIQMSIDPIHDIAPGLDHEGFNRAPIYPVGKLVNSIVEGDEDRPYGVGSSRYFGK